MPRLDELVEERRESLVALGVTGHGAQGLQHRMPAVVDAALDAPRQRHAFRGLPGLQLFVDLRMRLEDVRAHAAMPREVWQVRTCICGKTGVVVIAQARELVEWDRWHDLSSQSQHPRERIQVKMTVKRIQKAC